MPKSLLDSFETNIKEGQVYQILNFKVVGRKISYSVLQAPYALQISRDTRFIATEETNKAIPHYYFQFAKYDRLWNGNHNFKTSIFLLKSS